MIARATVERWIAERPKASAYDDMRQFSTALLAWARRDPHLLTGPAKHELIDGLRNLVECLEEVGGYPAVQALPGAALDRAYNVATALLARVDSAGEVSE